MSIEAMKQWREALRKARRRILTTEECHAAITSIEQAIAEAEKQEPVAMQMDVIVVNLVREGINKHRARELAEHFIKHTHPQPKREPLTIEQLLEHWRVAKVLDMTDAEIDFADYVLIARDVEALYGIKENT